MIRWAACLALTGATAAAAETFAVPPELWDRPRSARAVLGQPAVAKAVRAYLAEPVARFVIHHARSHEASLQAEELRAWLIALAVEADRIALRAGAGPSDPISIEVVTGP